MSGLRGTHGPVGTAIAFLLLSVTGARAEEAGMAPDARPEIDPVTSLPIAEGFDRVRLHCTGCHSGRLVAQNRASREGWLGLIRWMQRTQRLPDLGEDEEIVLDYLSGQLGPATGRTPRRARLAPALLPPLPARTPPTPAPPTPPARLSLPRSKR